MRSNAGLVVVGANSPPDTEKFPRLNERFEGLTSRLRLEENFDRFKFFEIYKEKEMNFRRWILALTVLALCVAGANAQIQGGSGTGSFTCNAINGAVTPTLRSEGITELVGDIVLQCTGGTNLALGAQIPQANITVFLNTQITSRLMGNSTGNNASEAVLFIDDPNTTEGGYGPTVPITLCTTPGTGCIEWVGNSTVAGGAGVPVATNPNTGTNGVFSPTQLAPGPNTFQGIINPDGKSVTFFGVPVMPPVTAGLIRQFRITNVRANATAIPAGANTPGNVQALISISGSSFVPLTNSQIVVGYVIPGLNASLRTAANDGGVDSATRAFQQCFDASKGKLAAVLRYRSNFGTAFKTRVLATANNTGQDATAVQNVPGSANNAVSESGFIFGGNQGNIVGTPLVPTSINSGSRVAGLADFGTRFKAVFNNIPAGVSIWVSTANLNGTAQMTSPGNSTTTSFAQLIVSDTSPENGSAAPVLTATGSSGSVQYVAFTPAAGTNSVTAVWEVINSNVNQNNQTFDFATWVAYTPNIASNVPASPGAITVSLSYAPISSTFSASSSATIPRFIDLGTGDNLNYANFSICTTSLLFPYITTVTGFETGIAIANTSMDPFATGTQAGTCTLYWYGNNNGGATNTPIPSSTTPSVAAGTVYTTVSSATTNAGPNFTGYMIATCNFQLAHGSAFVTDVGSRGILSGYLALVMTNTGNRTGNVPETLGH
jgi:hypothetical protein